MGKKARKTKSGKYKLDQKKFDKLIKLANKQEKTTLKVLYNAVVRSINILNENSSAASVKDWETTKTAYEEYTDELWQKHIEKPKPASPLSNLLAVVKHLTEAGWRLKRSTAYKHHEEGKLRPGKDGTYAIARVDKYAATFLKKLDGTANAKLDRFQADRAQAEMEKTQAQAEHWMLRTKILSGEYVEKGEFERALAQRASTFKVDIEAFIRSGAAGIIKLVGGKADKTPDLIEYMLGEAAGWLNRYAEERDFVVPAAAAAALLAKEEQKIDEETED